MNRKILSPTMASINVPWLQTYTAVALQCDMPILEALQCYYSYVQSAVDLYLAHIRVPWRPNQYRDQVLDTFPWMTYHDPAVLMALVQVSDDAFDCAKKFNPDLCRAATQKYGLELIRLAGTALEYVEDQPLEWCLAALADDLCSLRYVKNQTPEICMMVVTKAGLALQDVREQTEAICLAAVTQNPQAIKFVHHITHEIQAAANGK